MIDRFFKQLLFLTLFAGGVFCLTEGVQAKHLTSGISAVFADYLGETLHLADYDEEEPIIPPASSEKKETEADPSSETEADTVSEEADVTGTEAGSEAVSEGETEVTESAVSEGETEAAESEEVTDGAAGEPAAAGDSVLGTGEPAEKICGYTNIGIANIEGNLNIRKDPSEDGEICGKLPSEAACEILGEVGDWYRITSNDVEGYVKGEFLATGDEAKAMAEQLKTTVATVTTDVLNVREQPNTDCEIVEQVATDEELPLLEDMGEWLKVDVDGEERYVNAEFVQIEDKLKDALTMTEVMYGEGVSDVRVAAVNYAVQFVGNRYVWGGTSLTNGCDCSGFTMGIMAHFGVYLPHHSGSQALCGTRISTDELLPGDLVFYGGRRISHVAMYIGNGQIVHAANRRVGITISNVYYRTPTCCTRVLYSE